MNELLFNSLIEKDALENLLALNQIRKCDKEIEKYTNEINELKEEMTSILKTEDIDETYVEKIYKYKNILNNIDGETDRIKEIDLKVHENEARISEFQNKIMEVEDAIVELRKEIFETDDPSKVIECQNEVEENNVRLNDLNEILNSLITDNNPLLIEKEYLIAKNNDFDFSVPKEDVKKDLDKILDEFNNSLSKLELPVRENIEFCEKKISNRELEIEKYSIRKDNVIRNYPNALSMNAEKAYSDIKDLLVDLSNSDTYSVIDDKNIFDFEEEKEDSTVSEEPVNIEIDEENVEEPVIEETKDEVIEPTVTKEEPLTNEVTEESPYSIPIFEDEEELNEVEEKEEDTDDDIESVSYVLSDGESLANIAEKVYPSKDNWEAIYYFNKDVIDKYLVSNGISNDFDTITELANDTSLFTGIKLEIPTDFNYKI